MSFILAALNKAEQERQAGSRVDTQPAQSPVEQGGRQWLVIALGGVALSAVALALYLLWQQPGASDDVGVQKAPVSEAVSTHVAESSLLPKEPVAANKVEAPVHATSRLAVTVAASETLDVSQPDTASSRPTLRALTRSAKPSSPTSQKTATKESSTQGRTVEQESDELAALRLNEGAGTVVYQPVDEGYPAEQGDQVPLDQLDSIPVLHSLSESVRAQLPPLELNVHVFAETPGRRFVYINSRRYGEGAEIEGGVSLERITPAGVVLGYNGTLFRLLLDM